MGRWAGRQGGGGAGGLGGGWGGGEGVWQSVLRGQVTIFGVQKGVITLENFFKSIVPAAREGTCDIGAWG